LVKSLCESGAIIAINFSERRPEPFVKEFAMLLRASGLKLNADRHLDLFLTADRGLVLLEMPDMDATRLQLVELGRVGELELQSTPLAAARRSAGITYARRVRPLCLDGRSALVLDDELVARKVLSAALTKNGCVVDAVSEAEAAFSIMQQHKHDVVVLDINLGGSMNGFDFCRAIRSNPAFSKLPVVFVSGYSKDDPFIQDETVLASAYFEKPVKPAHLRDQILALL
jgi:CheY-like chemotaxis protein